MIESKFDDDSIPSGRRESGDNRQWRLEKTFFLANFFFGQRDWRRLIVRS